MSEIAIVKVRSPHDLEWRPSEAFMQVLRTFTFNGLAARVEGTRGQAFMPQLTLPYLAGIGRRYNERTGKNHHFTTVDEREENLDLDGFDLVLFTVMTPTAPATYRVADKLRRRNVPVVMGGIHVSTLPDEAAPHADSVVVGEAETALLPLLRDFDAGTLKPRYRTGRVDGLGELAMPNWHAATVDDYCPWVIPVQTSRGCRNACHFCSTTRFQGAVRRHRPIPEIVAELRGLQEQGVLTPDKQVFFTDNNIVSDSDHRNGTRDTAYARELFRALIPLGIHWTGQGEIGVGEDRELTALMAEAGCNQLLIGFESIDQQSFRGLGKRSNTVENYAESIDTLHRHGITNIGCFIMGLDSDTPDTFEATTAFIKRYVDTPQVSVLTPYPGTALHTRMDREGRILTRDWSQYDITHVVYEPRCMPPEELEQRYAAMLHELFSYPEMIKRGLKNVVRPTVGGYPKGFTRFDRFTSTFAPNLVYRGLGRLGRDDGTAEVKRDPVDSKGQQLEPRPEAALLSALSSELEKADYEAPRA
jgi:radical SAM superfamily enzyme YgiQ (UPF0313 family)